MLKEYNEVYQQVQALLILTESFGRMIHHVISHTRLNQSRVLSDVSGSQRVSFRIVARILATFEWTHRDASA